MPDEFGHRRARRKQRVPSRRKPVAFQEVPGEAEADAVVERSASTKAGQCVR